MTRVGVYCRISEDVEGLALGVARQEEDGRTVAGLRRWEVAGVYIDNDETAFGEKRNRPDFDRLLADLAAKRIDGIVAYDLDRFAREPVDLEHVILIYDRRQDAVFATVQGDIDLSTPDGLTMARVMVAFANKASRDTSRRVKRKHRELALRGVPVGGYRPFGYEPDRLTINEREAALVRQAVKDVLAGVGLHTICKQWNTAGIITTAGNPWRKSVLRAMLLSPRLAGYRVYQKEIARDADGVPVVGLHPPLIDVATWQSLGAVLRDPARGTRGSGKRKYVLSGLIRCGVCSSLLQGNAAVNRSTFYYLCKNRLCGKVGVSGPKSDDLVIRLVQRYFAEREVVRGGDAWPGEAELDSIGRRTAELMSAYAEGELSRNAVFPAVEKLEARRDILRAERSDWLRDQVRLATPVSVAEAWPDDVDRQRAVISSVLQAVVVRRAASPGGRFDPERLAVVYREAERAEPTALV